tara:strand:- start:242 stop:466 length:225 start_codon:yes stop_codon:yes gene_type:complete
MKYKKIFKVIFQNLPKDCNPSMLLSELNFDSMAQILLISELEGNYDTIIDPSELGNLLYLSDLISFLDKSIKIK